ncbi:MAG: glycosyltransferase [Gammaproteobacteria bacterium]|nr:glycosyltransferase [Gammaproteobacteria bacterium]
MDRIRVEAAFVRDAQSSGQFLKWLVRVSVNAARRLLLTTLHRRQASVASPSLPVRMQPEPPVSVATLGPMADAVLPPTRDVRQGLGQHPVDVVIAEKSRETRHIPFPTVFLSNNMALAVPALDLRQHNPVGWRRTFKDSVAALGPLDRLPAETRANRVVGASDVELIRHCHHLEDTDAFHEHPLDRARTLIRLAAAGVPIQVVDNDPKLQRLLGDGLHDLMKTCIRDADALTRELHSIRLRRIVLRDHSRDGRIRQICRAASVVPPPLPSVSILLATNRPKFVRRALANVARQNYPELELVLALHGDGFDDGAIEGATAQLDCHVEMIRLPSQRPLPAVLNAASHTACGTILTKMDDDDLYDAEHTWDLVLAQEYSGAHLVGKGAEVFYLQESDQTVERPSRAESYSTNVAGGTLTITRDDLMSIGGWDGVPPGVDRTLIDTVVRHGGIVYRTHGRGYIIMRHGRHSWSVADQYFLDQAVSVQAGWRGSWGGFDIPQPARIDSE